MLGFHPQAAAKRKPYANGGKIVGKGTGTSDSIKKDVPAGTYIMPADSTKQFGAEALGMMGHDVPVAVSNGEYQMPPEQVHDIGVQTLNAMRDATHAPVGARGFNPEHMAQADKAPRQFFADGGAPVPSWGDRAKSWMFNAMGENTTPERVAENRQAQAAREMQAKQAPVPTPVPRSNISQYAGGDALKRRMATIDGYANGGMVRGKGTGTSDSVKRNVPSGTYIMPADSTEKLGEATLGKLGTPVPVALSNGEFEMPPEQVHAVGVQTLDQLKSATHTPVRGFRPQDSERQFFASGGNVNDLNRWESAANALRLSNDRIAQSQGRMNIQQPDGRFDENKLAQAAEMVRQSRARMAQNTMLSNRGFAAADVPRQYLADGGNAIGKLGTRLEDSEKLYKEGNTAGALGKIANAGLHLQSDLTSDAVGAFREKSSAALDPVFRFGSALTGGNGGMATSLTPNDKPATAAAEVPPPATSVPASNIVPPAADKTPSASTDNSPTGSSNTAPAPRQVEGTNAYEHSRGNYSDNPAGMGFNPGFTGQPTAQNNATMQNIADRYSNQISGMAAQQMQQPQSRGFDAPQIEHSGNSWQARNDLRNLQVSANSIDNRPYIVGRGRNKQVITPDNGSMAAYQAALAADGRARGQSGDAGISAMRENAAIARTGMSEQGANSRDANRNALEAQRIGIAGQEAVFNRGVKGFEMADIRRRQAAQEAYANADEAGRKAIAEQYPDLFKQGDKGKMQFEVIRGKSDPITGAYSGDYAVAFDPNTRTMQRMDISGASQPDTPIPQAASERVVGQIYTAPNGQKVKWDGKGLLPV